MDLRHLAQALIVPLKSGLCSFNAVSEILLSIQADMVLPGCQTCDDIRQQIMNMKQQMEESEHRANTELQRLDRATETLTAEQSQLAQQKKQKTDELNNLNTELSSLQSTLSSYYQALETERGNLQTAENTLSDMRAKRDEAQRIRDAGIGVMFIPIVGWISGALMIGVGQVDMDRASDAADTARQEVANCESQVKTYSDKVQHYNAKIDQAQRDITEADNKICETEAKLCDMSVKCGVVADIQYKMRQVVTHLELLSGVGSVAELQTRHLILLEPVMKLLEEMNTVLGQISGNELLHSEGILSLMEDMKRNHRNLKELADTNKDQVSSCNFELLMDRVDCYGSAGQHVELRRLAQALIVPLKSGLYSFITVSEILLSINADMVLPGCQTFDDVRRQIMSMKLQMEESEQIAITELQQLDWETETLTAEQSQLARQKKKKIVELQKLNTKLSSLQSTLSSYEEALETERTNLESAEETLSDMRAKKDKAEAVRDIGIGIALIPIVGWIAGPIMIGVGQAEMNEASDAVDAAREEVKNCKSQVKTYAKKVQRYNDKIDQAECDITEADNKIHETEAKLRDMSEKRRVVAYIQDKMREVVTQLGLLSGVGSVVELQTRRLILLEPVMKLLEEMNTILGQISGSELLYREGILSLMEDMRRNHRKLKELADTKRSRNPFLKICCLM
ncbi:hypothetical protein INR49_008260 [Caranx melampygus]|nr:hypothetical protein INR49_008260 [Caranx melampygus]